MMAKITMMVGFVLVALGFAYWGLAGRTAPTALIPAYFGIALMICGARSRTENNKTRMLFMHVAVTIGLLGFLFPGIRAIMTMMKGATLSSLAVQEQLVMSVVCLVFTGMCVRSFIAARRTPPAEAAV
ncbi:hypothetical protein [Bryocella elongata]|nr:hypothetical protein [Bryocella elongata]